MVGFFLLRRSNRRVGPTPRTPEERAEHGCLLPHRRGKHRRRSLQGGVRPSLHAQVVVLRPFELVHHQGGPQPLLVGDPVEPLPNDRDGVQRDEVAGDERVEGGEAREEDGRSDLALEDAAEGEPGGEAEAKSGEEISDEVSTAREVVPREGPWTTGSDEGRTRPPLRPPD